MPIYNGTLSLSIGARSTCGIQRQNSESTVEMTFVRRELRAIRAQPRGANVCRVAHSALS
jgi:hypothetical protein